MAFCFVVGFYLIARDKDRKPRINWEPSDQQDEKRDIIETVIGLALLSLGPIIGWFLIN